MKKSVSIISLMILALLLSSCGPYRPLGYCPETGLFYGRYRGDIYAITCEELAEAGYDCHAYGEWCPVLPPTPTWTSIPPTDTPLPSNTPEPTFTPIPSETSLPTSTCTATPTSTGTPAPEWKAGPIFRMWLFTTYTVSDDWVNYCIILSETHPSVERQSVICGFTPDSLLCDAMLYNDDIWECDKYGYERMSLNVLQCLWDRHENNDRWWWTREKCLDLGSE